jgi:glucosamine-6-phosphate deaminase
VLGLATGSSPIMVYEELVRMHKEEGLSFSNVITFNLMNIIPCGWIITKAIIILCISTFDHIDIKAENINIPDGTVSIEEIKQYCIDYEIKKKKFRRA